MLSSSPIARGGAASVATSVPDGAAASHDDDRADAGNLRRDPLSGRLVVVAPGRARRPGAWHVAEPEAAEDDPALCPFCEGHESQTPPETLAVAEPGRAPDTPGWRARIVPNLYPAFPRHEVVVHTPRHVRSLGELAEEELATVAEAWRARATALRSDGVAYVQALVNEGRAAGASLLHTHSQLVGLPEEPPASAVEADDARCRLCELLAGERTALVRLVVEREGVAVLAPYASRLPYELLVVPLAHEENAFASDSLAAALSLTADALRRLASLEGPVPLNAWLHDGRHWHLEVLPRLAVLAGLELGAGIYVNTLAPEEAAERLRNARPH
jgi:UDPglucose--hexose-1-phosphate uridylyltransferase